MDAFLSAKTLLNRAYQHITEFDAWVLAYRNQKPYKITRENNPASGKTTHKARVVEQPPLILPGIAFDAVNCMRSALDHAVFDASVKLGGSPRPKYTKFPFGNDAGSAAKDLNRKYSEVPDTLRPFLQATRPYPDSDGGNQILWGLNELRNGKIHQILSAIISNGGLAAANLLAGGFCDFSLRSDWDAAKQEFTFLETGCANEIPLEIHITIEVSFSAGTPFADKPASDALKEMLTTAASIVYGIEAETARLVDIKP